MTSNILGYGALAIALFTSIGAHAQGVVGGATNGADQGDATAGPVGAIVGGAVGAVAGGAGGLLGVDQRQRFHEYVAREHRPSHRYSNDVRIGVILPSDGVQYYDVPPEYGVRGDSYTVVNDRTVLVDPRTHQVIQILD
jgi:hypothetical protein